MKPHPVVVTTICSLCDEPWEDHGDKPTAEDCVRLLKAKLARQRPPVIIHDRWYPQPYVVPTVRPYWRWNDHMIYCGSTQAVSTTGTLTVSNVTYRKPDDGGAIAAVAA